MLSELIKSVLMIVVAFLVRLALDALGVELDEGTFVAIVAAIVSYILALLAPRKQGVEKQTNGD
jgi:hypothetical protein